MRRLFLRDVLLIIVPLLALFTVLPFVYDNGLLLLNFVVFLVLAQGLNLTYGFSGYLPFGYVGFFGAGAYGFSMLIMLAGAPSLLAIAGGGVAAGLVGLLLAPLLRLQGAYFGLASLAASEALLHLIANPNLQDATGGPYGVRLHATYAPKLTYGLALGVLAVTMGLVAYLRHSRFGLQLQAARDNPVAASMAGIDIVRGRLLVWLASAVAAGLIGAIFAWRASTFFPEAVFDLNFSIFAIVFTLFGGAGTLGGPVVGVLLLYGLYNYIGVSAPQYFQLAFGLLIMGLVLFFPQGLAAIPRQIRALRHG
ncbi:MAG: branched-chain amino acid ABC transporter permease [Acetobacteraceae bacterium]|nr:branched-chain amino acid ABC transporter permease [Acetobacteraceae bacterium]